VSEDCAAGCCPHDCELPGTTPGNPGCPADLPGAPLPERAAHLYACQALSTHQIAALTGVGRQRITRLLRQAGIAVKPRGAGRRRSRQDAEAERLDALMADLYLQLRLHSTQIAELTGIPDRSVRDRLRARGVPMRTRGRLNREDRITIPPEDLAKLYLQAGLSADEAGKLLGVSRRVVLRSAHDQRLPVRIGGPPPRRGPSEIELITALYADPQVRRVLARHNVPVVTLAGPIWKRFPAPHRLTADLITDLYTGCGLGVHHIELITGRPAATVGALLRASGVRLRPPGGRSPFMRRWREDRT
jgi:transposase